MKLLYGLFLKHKDKYVRSMIVQISAKLRRYKSQGFKFTKAMLDATQINYIISYQILALFSHYISSADVIRKLKIKKFLIYH